MKRAIRCRKVTVHVEGEAGGLDSYQFFLRDDEPFDLVTDKPSGFPEAQAGGMTFSLPRWPASSLHRPPADEQADYITDADGFVEVNPAPTSPAINTDRLRDWNASQKWGPHDPDGLDGYCVINALCNEVDRLRNEAPR